MLVVPPQRVDDLVVLLDATQQLQIGGLIHVDAPATRERQRWSDVMSCLSNTGSA